MNSPSSLARWLLGNAAILSLAQAQPDSQRSDPAANEAAIMPGVFNTQLPQTLREQHLRFTVRPHFGDLIHEDYLGVTFATRYGLTPQWELNGDVDTYVAHGLRNERLLNHAGLSRVGIGAKYKFPKLFRPFWETAAGASYSFPVGRPPSDVTDGYRHFRPYLTMSHTFENHPNVTGFISYGLDLVSRTYATNIPNEDSLNDNSWAITPGFILHRGPVNYSLEISYSSTAVIGDRQASSVSLRPSLEWTLPPRFKFHARNRWVIGLGLQASYGSDGSDFGVNARIQTDFDFKRFLPWHRPKPETNP
ncbi:MAG: hypothetical protein JF599_01670 [Verrucomicrobia bacterium]|nr:hypothetical protein [Verrucomicrobiota bacterium]